MALSQKKSRPIVIDNERFRWAISPQSNYVTLVVEKENIQGRRIQVKIMTGINSFWLEYPFTDHLSLKVIKPSEVALIIQSAQAKGWNPQEKGSPMNFEWVENELIEKSKHR